MSDFLLPTQKNDFWNQYENKNNNVQNQNTQTDYWQNQSQKTMEQKQAQLDNRERYGVNVPDEYYEVFNKIISQAATPEEAQAEAYKIGSAVKYSQMMSIPLEEAYKNVDALNEAQFPDKLDQKGRFEALADMWTLGKNNVKLGELGQKLMRANAENDTELSQSLMAEIDALNQQNQLMQDNAPRSWVMQALEAGAQSLPFTAAVAGAGIVGNFIAPAAGTGASFAASSYLSAGTEYIDMLANGASPETARAVAMVSGGIQGLIEADLGITKGIVKGAARVAGKEVAENTAKKGLEEIGRKVFKRFHFGAGKKVLINYLENRGKDILGEGTEEFLQEITSIVGQEVAASLEGYDIPDDDFKSIVKQTTEAFRGGVLGALSMGFIPAGLNAAADVKSFKAIKDGAEVIESEEVFKEAVKDNPVFEGMSEQQKAETIHDVWQNAQNRKEEAANLEAQKIAEGRDAAEGAEEAPEENEDGTTEAQAVARNDAGRLYTSDDVSTDDAGNVTGGTFVIGDKTKSENNRYGYITYKTDEDGNITIENFKMTAEREGLRNEAFDEFAREHPDVNIEWNAIGSEAQGFKDALIEANPSGKNNGLNYYTTNELDNVAARKMVAEEVRKNIHNVKQNADGSYSRTDLNNKQVAAAVTLIESAARRQNMGLAEYVSKTFGNQIFGSREEFAEATLAQGENVATKAGGMSQGVAQANWREVGQMVKAVIYAGENADFSTWAHEMAHVFQAQLDGDLKSEAEAAFNVVGGDWTRSTYTFSDGRTMSSAEAFAYGFQDWLETGKAESEQMKNIFQKFAEFIADAYNRLRKHLDFSPEIENVFNKLLDGDDTVMSKALKAAEEQEGEYRAGLKRAAEEKEAQKKAAAEEAQRQAEAEREEESETTEYAENAPTAEELINGIEEVENEKEPETDAIDNALKDLPLTDEQKTEIADVLKDENSTRVDKAEAVTEAAESAYVIPDDMFFQIIGEIGAQNLDDSEVQEGVSRMQNLVTAKEMEKEGKDAKTIRTATAWERGGDGKWRYEIDDGVFSRPQEGTKWETKDGKTTQVPRLQNEGYLREFYDNPTLYKAYPDLKSVWISFKNFPEGESGSTYTYDGNIHVEINENDSIEEQKKTLVHEIQHIIQHVEGFAKGGSMDRAAKYIDEQNNIKKEIQDKALAWSWKQELEAEEKKHPELRGQTYLMDALLDEYKEDGYDLARLEKEGWIPSLDIRYKGFNLYVRGYDKEGFEDAYNEWSNGKLSDYRPKTNNQMAQYLTYKCFGGEVESRNVENRKDFTPEQRLNTLLSATEDVAPEDKIILFQKVYHGSGADFDKFDTENFALSGEGSMTFGYGTYLTDSEDIAREYAERQRPQGQDALTYKGKKIDTYNNSYELKELYGLLNRNVGNKHVTKMELKGLIQHAENMIAQGQPFQNLLESYKKMQEMIDDFNVSDFAQDTHTNLYTVEIPDNGYIVWDKPVRKQTADRIKRALFNEITTNPDSAYYNYYSKSDLMQELDSVFSYMEGQQLYRNVSAYLEGDEKASKFLRKIGYAGLKYPAGTIHGNGRDAYNYVIFNDEDAQIVDKLLFQTQAELMNEAQDFESWQEFMEYCETFHADDEVSPIPSDADAQWYQTFWETSRGVQTEQEKNEEAVQAKNKKEGALPVAVDALFTTYIKSSPEMVDSFLQAVADIDAMDLDSEEWRNVDNAEDAAQREKIDQLKDFINITLSDYNWQTALKRIQGGHEISEGLRKRLIGEMTDSFKARDFRALYAEVMNDPQYAVADEDSITASLNKKLKKYHDIVKPTDDISRWSPERRKQLAEQLQNREIAAKIKSGSLKLDDELDAYIKSLNSQIKEKQKQFDELEAETKADYQRIADKERRDLLKLHEQLLLASGKLKRRNAEIERKIKKGLKITEKYRYITQNLNANYDELFRKYNDLRNSITLNAEVQAALERQEQLAGIREDLNAKQKEKNLTAEVKKMRIQLVKKAMRRVPFARIDYNNARTVIAIQRMLEPNLLGGVNRFIGIDSPYLRGVISQIVTDSEYKEKILNYLSKNTKASQAFADFKKKLEDLKTIKDFDSWTAKDRKAAIRYLPKENWVRDLNLLQLAKEREESIDLDIGMEEYNKTVYDEKTGEPKTYKDKDGQEHNVTETGFRLQYDDELGQMVKDAVGADMFDKIVNMPFAEWTTEDLESLAQRIDEIYIEGRDLKAAKDEARKREAAEIRKRIEDAIKETGITFNDDDTPEERERKQKKIDKILGMNSDLKGTEAGKAKGPLAKLDRLIHGYYDMNVLRFARMLDGQSEGENVRMLYRREDDCYIAKQRSMDSRASAINKVMANNKITEGDLAKTVKVPELGTEFTVDELLYFLAADKDYVEDEKKLQKGEIGIDANDDYAATSRNAVMFGNMMSDMMSQEEKESWAQLDKEMEEALKNDTLTQEQKEELATGRLDKKPGTTRYIAMCHAKWETVLGVANNYLSTHPEYKALMEAIEADYASQYERMNEVSIAEFNQPVHRVKAYVPLVRRESNGDTNENQVKEDLLGAAGVGKQWADRGMTQRRVQISPLNQKPVQTGLFRTWGDSIERTEHFIAYAPYVRQLNAIYKSRDAAYTRRFIESRYGKYAIQYLDEYINEVANPNAGRIREKGAELLHVLRGKTAPAYLGWKASGIIKQGLTSPWPYMQFVNPAEYTAAALKFTFNPEMRDAISEKSIYMKLRRMDPVNDLIDEMAENAKGKVDRAWSKFSQIGMQGLEMIDWACVAPGWLACYEKKYNQLQNASNARYEAKMAELKERNMYADVGTSEYLTPQQMEAEARKEMMEDIETEAVRYADDCTRACQPSNRVTDLAPLFKNSSEAMKAFLQFQTSLNVIWQNLRYDMPYAVKQREFKRIAGTVIGYVCAGIFMNSVMEGIGGDDDDDDTQALRNLIYYSTTQFTDAIPIMGSEITNAMDKIITGSRAYSQSGTDMTPSATKLLNALQKATSGDWQKAASLTAEAIGLFMGAPVSGVKEINKLLGKPLANGEVDLKKGVTDVYGIAGDILEE